MGDYISSNSGSSKMAAMQEALANTNKPIKVKIKIKIKNEKPTGNARRTNQEEDK